MNTLFDAHIHFNLSKDSPASDLLQQLKDNEVGGCNLILNTPQEKEYFFKHWTEFEKSDINFIYSLTFDPDSFSFMRKHGLRFWMKIHPRIENISSKQVNDISKIISDEKPCGVVVDCWPDDLSPENDCGARIGAALAEKFPYLNIVLAHSGGIFMRETMFLTRKLNNIFYDTALTANYFFESAMQQDFSYALRFFGNRMMFGSDYPDFTVKAAIQRMKQIVDFASGNDDLYHRYSSINAQKVFCQEKEGAI